VALSTTMTNAEGATGTLSLQAYFPHGRTPGADVILAMPVKSRDATRTYFATAHGTLDAALSSTVLEIRDMTCGGHVKGRFVGSSGGFDTDLSIDLSNPDADFIWTIDAHALLCPSALAPAMMQMTSDPMPGERIFVTGNRLLDPASLASVKATPSRAVDVVPMDMSFTVGVDADPFHSVAIDLSNVRDVLGSALALGVIHTRALTASVTDPTFATDLPDGTVIGTPAKVIDGSLHVPAASAYPSTSRTMIGIGTVASSKKLHLGHRFVCFGTSVPEAKLKLVSDGGAVIPIALGCGDAMQDTSIDVTAGTWALDVSGGWASDSPACYGLTGSRPATPYELDDLAFD
jgi:hypothetical protein